MGPDLSASGSKYSLPVHSLPDEPESLFDPEEPILYDNNRE